MDTSMLQQNIPDPVLNGKESNSPNELDDSKKPEEHHQTYDALFPSLPLAAPSGMGVANGAWNKKPVLANSSVTQILRIPVEERKANLRSGFGADDSLKTLKNVIDKTGASIEMSGSKDKSLTFLIIGKHDTVIKARRELLAQFQTQGNQVIAIPKEHHRYILGKGGSKLQELEVKTATKISIPKVTDTNDQITITGPKEGIEKAIHEITIISDEQSKQAYEIIKVPKIYHPFINGPNGENARNIIGERQNVRINIPPLSVMKDELSVAGEKENVLYVVDKIKDMHKDMQRRFSEVSVEVKKSQHKYIIGPKGNTINEILSETGVFVEMPLSDSTSETITLRGPQEKLGFALTKVYEKANSVVSYDVNCPTWLHKYIIGKKGASIQKITNELTKVHVEFLEDGDKIKIEGPPSEADKARDILEKQAKDLIKNTDFVEIPVDSKYHKHIIGKGGSTVNKIKQETDVMINIPDTDRGSTSIRIEGKKEGVKQAKEELMSLVKKMENEREKDLIIENRFHRQLIGPKGESIQKLREEFSQVQISFPDLGSKSDVVKLRGPKDEVEKCSKTLNKSLKELREINYQVKIPIFKQFHKDVIGKGGANIRKIRTETDTKIELPEPGSDSDVITITGKKENVEKAQKKIQQIQSEMANVVNIEINIPHNIHNTMIGAGGKLIQSVMEDCGGVHIKFPPPNDNTDKVVIRGPKDDAEKAKKMLLDMANEKQISSVTAEVKAKPEHHKFLIGKNGSNVQAIRDKTGARIIFPSDKDKERDVITIVGTKEAVNKAKIELETKIKGLDNIVEETMNVDPKYHKYFVARRGEVLRQIGEEYGGVIISFPRTGVVSDKVTLKGAKNCLDGARDRILEIVTDLENQITIDCNIDQQYHRTIMGARGSKVQQVCAKFNVQIKIPERNPVNNENGESNNNDSNIIKISGKKENCDLAAKALHDLVPINIEVNAPFEFHRYIIGAKGVGVRQLMDTYDVNVKVPSSDQHSDIIIITGTPTNVEEARKALAEKVKALELEKADREAKNFELKIEVKAEYHPKIIGRKGAVIQQLRKDHDVNIQLPKKDAPEENVITIIGYEESANNCKDAIMKIVNEYESMVKEEVEIDHRVHSMIIGRKGTGIRKIMQDFKVDLKLPKDGDDNPNLVVIMGQEENILDCREHLLNLQEEYIQDILDKEWMEEYTKPKSKQHDKESKEANGKGFHVSKGAPWQGASDDAFPSLGGAMGGPGRATPSTPVWGPSRR